MGKFNFANDDNQPHQYKQQIERVNQNTGFVDSIEDTVEAAIDRISRGTKSFVIFGEPQSGKTEMMICLTAKLLDEGHNRIVILVNDNVSLQNQNLARFARSGLSPTPIGLSDIKQSAKLDSSTPIIVFCKKNKKDLEALADRVKHFHSLVVIDDEGDYATPNSKINRGEQSSINKLVQKLIGQDGLYIAVTATPARLDLNRTFDNDSSNWIYFKPYPNYSGRETFFKSLDPDKQEFCLLLLSDSEAANKGKSLRTALVHFVVNVAALNLGAREKKLPEQNWSLLIHTSGKIEEHEEDRKIVDQFFSSLESNTHRNYDKYFQEIEDYAHLRYPTVDSMEIARYVYQNRQRRSIKVVNSDGNQAAAEAINSVTSPDSRFTIGIGGNVISRGVTFDNLLGMYFTREARVIQQDTYIQRARMFGNRTGYLQSFELHIPQSLYLDWFNAFTLHSLSMASIINGEPVWIEGSNLKAAASSSTVRSEVLMDSGQVSFPLFNITKADVQKTVASQAGYKALVALSNLLKKAGVNKHVLDFINTEQPNGDKSVVFHQSRLIKASKNIDDKLIWRARGLYGGNDYEDETFPGAVHHLKIFYNSEGTARLVYHYRASGKNIRFLRMKR